VSDLDAFVQSIIQEGELRAREIIEKAKSEAEAIIKEAEQKAREKAEQEAQIIKNTILNKLVDEKMRNLIGDKIKLKDTKIRAIRDILAKKIKDVMEGKDRRWDYTRILYMFLKRAISELGSDKVIVSANSRDLEFIKSHKKELEQKLREDIGKNIEIIIGDKIDVLGGVVCGEPAGEKISYSTVDGRLEEVLKKKSTFIVRRLGMISSNRFRALIRELFEKIDKKIEIKDAMGQDLTLDKYDSMSDYVVGDNRVDLVCLKEGGSSLAVYITLSEVTEERLRHFKKSVENFRKSGVAVDSLLFVAFSGVSSQKIVEYMRGENIYLLTKKEIIDLSNKINAGLF